LLLLVPVAQGLDTPWAIDFLPDGRMIFTERKGTVSIWDGNITKALELAVDETGEGGLLGIAVDPLFNQTNSIFLYYTDEDSNRISMFRLIDGRMQDETVILDDIPSSGNHNGGRLKFGPDGYLYATTGDAGDPQSAQDLSSLAGKILRLGKDGSVPEDNPFGNYVWSYGHRNPQGLAWDNETMYASEHGPSRMDEINIIQKGGNYGWPDTCLEQEGIRPIICYTDFTLAPSGIAMHNGILYVTGLRGEQLRKIDLETMEEKIAVSGIGRIREAVYHEGLLYIATSNMDGRGSGEDSIYLLPVTSRTA
jgi:aldose sugar dehydrogenase